MLALLCALCAAGVLVFALGRYKAHVAQPVPQATVLIANGEIAKGTTGTEIAAQRLYRSVPVAADQVSPGALSNAAALGDQTVSANILPGQQLTSADFATLAAASLVLQNGQRAVELDAGGAQGAVDITQPNSRVDIWGKSATSGGDYALIASNVLILKPATATAVTIGNQSVGGGTLVVEVPESLVPKLLDLASSLYLTLRPGKSGAVPATPVSATTTTTTAGAH